MEIDVIITRDGTVAVLARGTGEFLEAQEKVLSVLQQLTAAGIPLENISTVERHRHPETDTVLTHGVRQKTQT